jgi:hypothetical protein
MGLFKRFCKKEPEPKEVVEPIPDWYYAKAEFDYSGYGNARYAHKATYIRTEIESGKRQKVLIEAWDDDSYNINEHGELHIDFAHIKSVKDGKWSSHPFSICYIRWSLDDCSMWVQSFLEGFFRITVIKEQEVNRYHAAIRKKKEERERYLQHRADSMEIWDAVHEELDNL